MKEIEQIIGERIKELQTTSDVAQLFSQSLTNIYKQGFEDAIKICDKEINQFREPEMSAYKNGKVAEAQFIRQQLQNKLEEIK